MLRPLRVLLVEDRPTDAELVVRELRRAGFDPNWSQVDTEEEYLSQLSPDVDLILSDYTMPNFSGLRALELVNQSGLDLPFIIVSGSIGEDIAVSAMKQGATDYLLKDRLERLGPATTMALEQKQLRDEKTRADAAFEQLQRQHELILQSVGDGIHGMDLNGNIVFENPAGARMLGWEIDELVGKPAHETIHHSHPDGSDFPKEQCSIYATFCDGITRNV
ncbi:MAG: hypothetical protein QOD99_308, partial [Chthoniobacter sp.]|nr:hypothetical protein [Chthoniobacter sp.]